jgi:hypothetical protein
MNSGDLSSLRILLGGLIMKHLKKYLKQHQKTKGGKNYG